MEDFFVEQARSLLDFILIFLFEYRPSYFINIGRGDILQPKNPFPVSQLGHPHGGGMRSKNFKKGNLIFNQVRLIFSLLLGLISNLKEIDIILHYLTGL